MQDISLISQQIKIPEVKEIRKSRWEDFSAIRVGRKIESSEDDSRWRDQKSFTPPSMTFLPNFLTPDQIELILRQQRIEDISRRLTANDYDIHDPDVRSPSPEPIYDQKTGQRINTREFRAREALVAERNRCIEEWMKIDSEYKPPGDYRPPLRSQKLYIPMFGATPPSSYISLILGPRGVTQKALQKKTGCKIYVRGKGATRGKNYQFQDEDEPIHILITSSNEENLAQAVDIIEPILNSDFDDVEGALNRTRLMQIAQEGRLALKAKSDWCQSCGEHGHKKWAWPNRIMALEAPKPILAEPNPSKKQKVATKSLASQLEEFAMLTGIAIPPADDHEDEELTPPGM